ncbi:MAG TPA: serine/threonine-protein kinase [Acidimicrobiia bacterium]|nr:serine/threonine-protein kinase [Acidimicrobiia bacterium]
MAEDAASLIAQAVPDYAIERELGRGGMGVVFLGRHQRLGRKVAIKELPPSFASEPEVRERFSTEARTLASLSHPHIVPIYDYVERDGLCLIVMEELPGGTVWERFTSVGLTPPTACAVVVACCAALEYAHAKGVLHLDVKPDNLMFDAEAAVKVTDFGISRVISGDRTLATVQGQVLGTPAYMSPEQARGDELTPASDVYSAGVMLYELLSGNLPWQGATTASELLRQRLDLDPIPLRDVAPSVPQGIADVVMRAIARDASHRFARAEDFGVAVAEACAMAWGPDWLSYADVAVLGSERITRATRATGSQPPAAPAPAAPTGAPAAGGDRSTVIGDRDSGASRSASETVIGDRDTGDSRAASETVIGTPTTGEGRVAPETIITGPGSSDAPRSAETIAAGAAAPAAGSPASTPPAAPAAPPEPLVFEVVRAAGSEQRIDGANLNDLRREDLIAIEDVLDPPPRGRVAFALAVIFTVAAFVLAVQLAATPERTATFGPDSAFVGGADVATGVVELDLSENVEVQVPNALLAGADRAVLRTTAFGVTVGEEDTELQGGAGTIDPKTMQYLASGNVTGHLELYLGDDRIGEAEFPAEGQHAWYLTALGIGSGLVLLAGIANLESSFRPLRRGRRRVSAVIGAAISGAMVAGGGVVLATSAGALQGTTESLIGASAAGAIAATSLAIALVRRARRKRMRVASRRAQQQLGVTLPPR